MQFLSPATMLASSSTTSSGVGEVMISQSIWLIGIGIEALLLARSVFGRIVSHYPLFYTYICFVLAEELVRFGVHQWYLPLYGLTYWITAVLGIFFGCAVVFEVYRVGLMLYPGAARMARNSLALVFILAVTKVVVGHWNAPQGFSMATYLDLELTLRVVQGLTIIPLVILFLVYSIPFGRNLKGMLLGYGLFVGMSIISLTHVSFNGSRVGLLWSKLYPISYLMVLVIWTAYLWSYAPSPEPSRAVNLENQYQRMAAGTRRRLHEARGYLGRAAGQ